MARGAGGARGDDDGGAGEDRGFGHPGRQIRWQVGQVEQVEQVEQVAPPGVGPVGEPGAEEGGGELAGGVRYPGDGDDYEGEGEHLAIMMVVRVAGVRVACCSMRACSTHFTRSCASLEKPSWRGQD